MNGPAPGARGGGRRPGSAGDAEGSGGPSLPSNRHGRYAGVLAIVILIAITINTLTTKPNGAGGIAPGQSLAPFAVPLVQGSLGGDADVATGADQGAAGRVPACAERGAQILNVCELYEQGPVVLALFVDSGSCAAIVGDLQALAPSFPGVRFAAVAIKGERGPLLRMIGREGLTLPMGIDADGALLALYRMASCPQVSFAYPGGVVQSPALLLRPGISVLRRRVAELVAASRARGWRGPVG